MKKIYFAIAACAIFAFAACNNSTETTGSDSMADSTPTEQPAPAAPADTNAAAPADSNAAPAAEAPAAKP